MGDEGELQGSGPSGPGHGFAESWWKVGWIWSGKKWCCRCCTVIISILSIQLYIYIDFKFYLYIYIYICCFLKGLKDFGWDKPILKLSSAKLLIQGSSGWQASLFWMAFWSLQNNLSIRGSRHVLRSQNVRKWSYRSVDPWSFETHSHSPYVCWGWRVI